MDDPPSNTNELTIEIDDNVEVAVPETAVYEKKKKKRNRRH